MEDIEEGGHNFIHSEGDENSRAFSKKEHRVASELLGGGPNILHKAYKGTKTPSNM